MLICSYIGLAVFLGILHGLMRKQNRNMTLTQKRKTFFCSVTPVVYVQENDPNFTGSGTLKCRKECALEILALFLQLSTTYFLSCAAFLSAQLSISASMQRLSAMNLW